MYPTASMIAANLLCSVAAVAIASPRTRSPDLCDRGLREQHSHGQVEVRREAILHLGRQGGVPVGELVQVAVREAQRLRDEPSLDARLLDEPPDLLAVGVLRHAA